MNGYETVIATAAAVGKTMTFKEQIVLVLMLYIALAIIVGAACYIWSIARTKMVERKINGGEQESIQEEVGCRHSLGGHKAKLYRCEVCGWIYDEGDPENNGMPFEYRSDGWQCPACGANREWFREWPDDAYGSDKDKGEDGETERDNA
jgi:rubredoxin